MKKTISINISGVVFNIEEDAYEDLKRYLETISSYFTESEGREEIMTDIESRIAELFQEKLSGGKNVVTASDVTQVIDVMGRPEEYLGDDESYSRQANADSGSGSRQGGPEKKRVLFRDTDRNLFGGVCAGIAHYFGWDPIWIRIAWIISVFTLGLPVFIYVILWIVVPGARTSAEKLQMRGEPVNVDTIKKKVDETIAGFKAEKGESWDSAYQMDYAKGQVSKGGDLAVDLIKRILKLIGRVLGLFLFVGGMTAIVVMLYSYLDGSWFNFNGSDLGLDFGALREVLFNNDLNAYTMVTGIGLLTIIPIVALVILGARLLFSYWSHGLFMTPTMIGLWVIGFILVAVSGISLGKEFSSQEYSTTKYKLEPVNGVLYIESLGEKDTTTKFRNFKGRHGADVIMKSDSLHCRYPELKVITASADEPLSIDVERMGRGFTGEDAYARSEKIAYDFNQQGDTLTLDNYFRFAVADHYRGQEVAIVIHVPEGQEIKFSDKTYPMMDYVATKRDMRLRDLLDKHWVMGEDGLELFRTIPIESGKDEELITEPQEPTI